MANMKQKQVVEITVKKDGSFTFQAKEGFSGQSCRDQTKNLELVLGGQLEKTENTKDYYSGGRGDASVNLNLK